MDRSELERLDRESLVARAQAAGIRRARVLTRPELIDELLRLAPVDSVHLKRSRGFFGLARDLLSRIVERGLHLPDAAERLREALDSPLPQVPRPEPQAVPTVTLAEIYAAQGHKQRAVETLKRVLEAEPDHAAARELLDQLQAPEYVAPPPPLPPEAEERPAEAPAEALEPAAEEGSAEAAPEARSPEAEAVALETEAEAEAEAAALAPVAEEPSAEALPPAEVEAPTLSECIALPLHPNAFYVWWRLSAEARSWANDGRFVVRVLVIVPTWDGPLQRTRDVAVDRDATEVVLRDLPRKAIVRIAVGVLAGDGSEHAAFVPLAHSPALEAGPTGELVEWTLRGTIPVAMDDPRAAIQRAVEGAARARHADG